MIKRKTDWAQNTKSVLCTGIEDAEDASIACKPPVDCLTRITEGQCSVRGTKASIPEDESTSETYRDIDTHISPNLAP